MDLGIPIRPTSRGRSADGREFLLPRFDALRHKPQATTGSVKNCGGRIDRPQFEILQTARGWTNRMELRERQIAVGLGHRQHLKDLPQLFLTRNLRVVTQVGLLEAGVLA